MTTVAVGRYTLEQLSDADGQEAMILHVEALGSPTHPLPSSAWTAACPQFWGSYYGQEQLSVGPLFDSRYSGCLRAKPGHRLLHQ